MALRMRVTACRRRAGCRGHVSGWLLVTALVTGSAACSGDEPGTATATTVEPSAPMPTVESTDGSAAEPTAEPADGETSGEATLRSAAAGAGMSIGVHVEGDAEAVFPLVVREFDRVTVHGITISAMQPERGQWNFAAADQMMDLAREHDLSTHGFHWLWSQTLLDSNPAWFAAITDPDELWAVLDEHLATVVERYPDLGRINVVNEPLEVGSGEPVQNQFHDVLGPDYVAEAFRRADAIAPDYELFINENLTEYNPDKAAGLVAMVTALVDAGVPIDGVGFQTHLFAGDPDWELFEDTMRRIDDLGLTVSVTELDAPTAPDLADRDQVQAERMANVVELCLAVQACDSVIIWGVDDGNTWIDWFLQPGMEPLLFTEDLEPKASYDAVLAALRAAGDDGS